MLVNYPNQDKLYLYNKHHQRYSTPDLEPLSFYFFGSGSSGNSVFLKESHVLIDLGFPYKKYVDLSPLFWYDCRYVFLTHEHTDHLNPSTLLHLLRLYPHLKFVISQRMFMVITNVMFAKRFNSNLQKGKALQTELKTKYKSRFIFLTSDTNHLELPISDQQHITVTPYFVTHERILNVAYQIDTPKHHVLYSSDLDHVFVGANDPKKDFSLPLQYNDQGQPMMAEHPYDLMFIEANYDEDILEEVLARDPENAHARGNLRHISEQETWHYIDYTLSQHGIFIPLHASQAFGTLIQHLN